MATAKAAFTPIIGSVEVVEVAGIAVRFVTLAESRAVPIAVVMCGIAVHVQLVILRVQRNDRVPVGVHEFAAFVWFYTAANPFIERRYTRRNDGPLADGHPIGGLPISPVLQVQTYVVLDAICRLIIHLAATTNQNAERLGGVCINGCAREIDGVVVDNPVATGCVYEAADLGRVVCSYSRVVRSFEGIGAVAVVHGSIANGNGSFAPAVAQKATGALERITVPTDVHLERAERKAQNVHVLIS